MLLSERDAKRICQQLLGLIKADDAVVSLLSQTDHHLRFAANNFTTNGARDNVEVSATVWIGGRNGSISTNETDESSLAKAAAEVEQIARLSPVDPEYLPTLGPQRYQRTQAYVEATADISVSDRAKTIGGVISNCEQQAVIGAGLHQARASAICAATKNGNLWYERSSLASLSLASRTLVGNGSGYFLRSHHDARKLDTGRIVRESIRKALTSREPRVFDAGMYTVILEPQAVADLMLFVRFAFDARSAEEGRSPFSAPGGKTKVGERIFDERIDLYSDPWHPQLPGPAALPSGIPAQKYYFIRKGILENLAYSRFWASRKEKAPSPGPVNTILEGSGPLSTVDDMIASTDRGLLVTRFWYVRPVNQRELLLTGLTRDGLWYIEKGKIQFPVRNLRFNQSILELFAPGNLEMISAAERVSSSELQGFSSIFPALKAKRFRFTSQSDAV